MPVEKVNRMPEDSTKKLQSLLRKLFQFEHADLDFGIYRIMNKKRDAIENFIEKDLIAAVEAEFGKVSKSEMDQLETEVKALAKELGIGVDDDQATLREMGKKVPALQPLISKFEQKKSKLLNLANCDEYKAEVFNHIYQFFSRYYDNGDFMSLRRYSSKQKYAIPYNGEEVLLHWANKDQYYIKTGEYFFNYAFRIGDYTIRFQIVQAETSMNNVKGENRFFVLRSGEGNVTYDANAKELKVLFEYRTLTDAEKAAVGTRNIQDTLNQQAKEAILAAVPVAGLKDGLTREIDGKTPLAKHLAIYAKKNTSDYFIHKDLGGFLRQELDFYIKNEMIDIDDLGTDREVPIEQYLNRVRVMKAISLKIIDFLAQIENFQKKLWEKKKFVLKSEYCMTLDHVPEEFYPEIVANKAQIEEWKRLYSIGESTENTSLFRDAGNSIDIEFLKSQPYLMLDTKFFPQEFKDRLLAIFDDLDDTIGGLMIKSENWQALNLLQERYREQVKCIYIDPPYNTGGTNFNYKNGYQHSSWLCMISNSIMKGYNLLRNDGLNITSIDDFEVSELSLILQIIFNSDKNLGTLIVENKPSGRTNDEFLATCHEYYLFNKKNSDKAAINFFPLTEAEKSKYSDSDDKSNYKWRDFLRTGGYSTPEERPNSYYPIYLDEETGKLYLEKKTKNLVEILPVDSSGKKRVWRKTIPSFLEHYGKGEIRVRKTSLGYKIDIIDRIKMGTRPKSIWVGPKYDAASHGTKLLKEIIGDSRVFDFPKSVHAIRDVIYCATISDEKEIVMDYFAGSGTTAHAVLNLNREEIGNRKYILVEMADYFDTIMKPRIQKVVYSSEWKEGKPQNTDGISHIFKYMTLEQYEDTLNNIEFIEGGTAPKTLMDFEGYFLRYMLDFETRESPCRMNVTKLERPFDYTLRITRDSQLHNEIVDLVETFNYLLGLKVKRIRTFNENGTSYRVIHGETLAGESMTIIWRTTTGLDLKKDKQFIEETILKDPKFKAEKVYINGDFHVEGALPIEPEFQRLMGA